MTLSDEMRQNLCAVGGGEEAEDEDGKYGWMAAGGEVRSGDPAGYLGCRQESRGC